MLHTKLKHFILLLGLLLPAAWCGANDTRFFDGLGHIMIKESILQGTPKGSTIQASINGHTLPMGADKAQLQFTNAYGVVVATCDLSSDDGQKVIDLRSLASGVYTYTLFCGKLSQSGKLVIEK